LYARAKERQKALAEVRKAKREYRKKSIPLSKLKSQAQHEFNRFIRARDFGQPCICCGRIPEPSKSVKGHVMDAGHYRSVGAAQHLRFNEDNAHAQSVHCNRDKSGNTVEYRPRLIAKIGLARVELLESDYTIKKWDREELIAIRKLYLGKWKALEAARA
jgi:hypothetical protein